MQHHYRYYQGLRRIKTAVPLAVGSAIHSMIEAHHERGTWKPELKAFRAEFSKLFAEEREELGDLPTVSAEIVENYFNYYQDDGLIYPKRRRNISTEIPIEVELDSKTKFVGFIDAYPQDAEGRNWLMDHKTCKVIPDEDSRFSDLQLLLYNWLLPQLSYPKPYGVIWDYIRTKPPTRPKQLANGSISKDKSIDTTYDVYMSTVIETVGREEAKNYLEFAEQLKGKEEKFFRRVYLPHPNQTMVTTVVIDVLATAKEIHARGPYATERNLSYDCVRCSYYSLCQTELRGLDSSYMRKTDFTLEKGFQNAEENNSEE